MSTPEGLKTALNSLQHIADHIESLHLFIDETMNKSAVKKMRNMFIYETKAGNIGPQFKKALNNLEDGSILFLFEGDYVSSKEILNYMNNDVKTQPVISKIATLKDIKLMRPLFIRVSFFKSINFFQLYRMPFNEALVYYWQQTLNDKEIIVVETDFIKHSISNLSKNRIQTLEFYGKVQGTEKHRFQGKSDLTLTVIIANYNMCEFIETSISSSILQSIRPEKILVIDDGSSDNSISLIEKYADLPIVEVVKQKNTGKARALNAVIKLVETDFILELDADDWLDYDAVYTIKEQLEKLDDVKAVLYGNFRNWRTSDNGEVRYSKVAKGWQVHSHRELLKYLFPLGPRIYRTTSLKSIGGFPIIDFEGGRLYEDVSVLSSLLSEYKFHYHNFTVYNVREHPNSITKKNHPKWSDFIKNLPQ